MEYTNTTNLASSNEVIADNVSDVKEEPAESEDKVDFSEYDEHYREYKKGELLFYVQAIILAIIVIACIVNLSLENGDQTAWTSLLSTSLGILLPQPGFNIKRKK